MKLELKNLAPYLPYGLKMQAKHSNLEYSVMTLCDKTGLSNIGISDVIDDIECFKPILRPLSDLDSGDVDGLFFSEWLIETYYNIGVENQLNRIEEDIRWVNHCDLFLINHLLEWHFDVFGLIDNGLAIDINTL